MTKLIRFVKLYEDGDLIIKPGEIKKLSKEHADSLVERGFAEYALGDTENPTNAKQKVRLSKNSQGLWVIALEGEGFYLEPQRDRRNWNFRVKDFMTPSRPPAPTSTVTLDSPQKLRTSQSATKIRDVFKALYDSDKNTQLDEAIRLLQDNSWRWEPDEETIEYKKPKTFNEPSPGDSKYIEQIKRNDSLEYVIYDPDNDSWNFKKFYLLELDESIIKYYPMNPVPWPLAAEPREPNATLWDDIYKYIYDHVDLPDPRLYDVLTSWIFLTYIPEAFTVAPYLRFLGKKNVGKTRGLESIRELCYRGTLTPSLTEPVLFRFVSEYKITFLLDETEIYSSEQKQAVQSILNAGYKRGQHAYRMEQTESGKWVPQGFNVFGPKALAGTEELKDTLESRCIQIVMERNTRDVNFLVDQPRAKRLRSRLLLWRFRRLHDLDQLYSEESEHSEISEVYTEGPKELREIKNGRIVEIYSPLIQLAEPEAKDSIVSYAIDYYERSQIEETDTYEAQVLLAIRESVNKLESGKFSTRQVTDEFNLSRLEIEHLDSRTIGRIITKLGFEPKRMTGGKAGYIFDLDRVNRLSEEYGIPPLEPSLTSLNSLTSPNEDSNLDGGT
jgi:hypothetical protein